MSPTLLELTNDKDPPSDAASKKALGGDKAAPRIVLMIRFDLSYVRIFLGR